MKRAVCVFAALLSLCFCACAEKEGGGDRFAVTLSAAAEMPAGEITLGLYDKEGLELGTALLKEGKNFLPSSCAPCYAALALPEGYDCPAVRADGSDLSFSVSKAEYSELDGGLLYTYTVFLENFDPSAGYRLQMCRTENGETGYCKTDGFRNGKASLGLADGNYLFEIFSDGALLLQEERSVSHGSVRFTVCDLKEV